MSIYFLFILMYIYILSIFSIEAFCKKQPEDTTIYFLNDNGNDTFIYHLYNRQRKIFTL